jgi:predicted negative regulator of RcsB-dependent stress response
LSKLNRRFPRVFSGAAITLVTGFIIVALAVETALLWQRSQTLAARQLLEDITQLSTSAPLAGLEEQPATLDDYSQTAEGTLLQLLAIREGDSLYDARQLYWLGESQRAHAERSLFEYCMVMAAVTAERALWTTNVQGNSSDWHQPTTRWLARCAEFPEYSNSSATFQVLQQLTTQADSLSIAEISTVASSLDALLLSRIALHERQSDAAARLLQPLPDDSPFKALFWITLGQVYLNSRDFDSARLTLSLATAAAPNCSTAYELRAEAAAGKRDFAAAVEDYARAIELADRKAGLWRIARGCMNSLVT